MNASVAENLGVQGSNEGPPPAPAVGQRTVSEVPLRVKGFLAFAAVVIYAVLLTTFTFNKKAELVDEFERLQNLYKIEEHFRQVDATAFHILMARFIKCDRE